MEEDFHLELYTHTLSCLGDTELSREFTIEEPNFYAK
jgi:hypothetical protein